AAGGGGRSQGERGLSEEILEEERRALGIPGIGAGARAALGWLLLGGRIGLARIRGARSRSGLRWFCIGSVRRGRRIGRGRLGVERAAARPAEIVRPSARRRDRPPPAH